MAEGNRPLQRYVQHFILLYIYVHLDLHVSCVLYVEELLFSHRLHAFAFVYVLVH